MEDNQVVDTMDLIVQADDEGFVNAAARIHQVFADWAQALTAAEESPYYDSTNVNEGASMHKVSAEVFGNMIMQYFDWHNEGDGKHRPSVNQKRFLVELADVLGPDHLENLRKSVAFMIKVDGF